MHMKYLRIDLFTKFNFFFFVLILYELLLLNQNILIFIEAGQPSIELPPRLFQKLEKTYKPIKYMARAFIFLTKAR